MYLATSPHLFPVVCAQLGAAGLNGPHVRVVLEKPLGHDLASAQEINRVVRRRVQRTARRFASTTTWASRRCRT